MEGLIFGIFTVCSRISDGGMQCKVQTQGKNKVFRSHNLTAGTGLSCQIYFISQNLKDASIACHFLHNYHNTLQSAVAFLLFGAALGASRT